MLAKAQIKLDTKTSLKASVVPKFYFPVPKLEEGQLEKDMVYLDNEECHQRVL